ncbi:MAG: flagellar hook-length control protein FliK [Candidatus Saganbacteria bacterium]|nr:flagellar hook-length control protein FliK [Candidatus Saganbacteria bacterium]
MPEIISPVAASDSSTSLYGNSSGPKNSETSFEENLKTEEEKLKTKSLFFSPWSSIQTLMAALSSNYDDSLTLSKIENEFDTRKEPTPPQAPIKPTEEQKPETVKTELPTPPLPQKIYKLDPKVFQDILSRSLGAFNIAPAFMGTTEKFDFITKVDLQQVIDEITKQATIVKNQKQTELLLGLKPEQLGEMLLKITNQNGMLSIQILANEETKKSLDQSLEQLKNSLADAHLNIGNLSVDIGNFGSSGNHPNLFSDIPNIFSDYLVEKEPTNMLNFTGTQGAPRRTLGDRHLIDWEA